MPEVLRDESALVQLKSEVESEEQVELIGDVIRWIKCIFRDCDSEDAAMDHKIAEQERAERVEKKRQD